MTVNKLIKFVTIGIIVTAWNCNFLKDISIELQGCDLNEGQLLLCLPIIESHSKGITPSQGELDACLIVVFSHERCKKRLRENSIP